jgi:hypothetical protein
MSEYSPEWLALREPYDIAARNAVVLDTVASAFLGQATISVVDLACGTGATLRAVRPHLPSHQSWTLVDHSLALLALASPSPPANGPIDLVTTSALLDLVSLAWLDRLIAEVAARRLPFYGALTYDGRAVAEPVVRHDLELLTGFNLHQRTDKGFGPALGPTAAAHAAKGFEEFGYAVVQGHSDWMFGPNDRAIQDALFAGWADIGLQTTTLSQDQIAEWLNWRRTYLAQGRSKLQVGHVDIFARPIGAR